MSTRVPWQVITEFFSGQWVALEHIEWDWNSPHPALATVRYHASDRSALLRLVAQNDSGIDLTVLYVGPLSHFSAPAMPAFSV